jgi:hypothetical protein
VRSLPSLALVAALSGLAATARAYDLEIASETIGQGYEILGGNGERISRRRLDQYLGLNVFNLGPKDKNGAPGWRNQWYFASSMRLQLDFGDYPPANNTWGPSSDTTLEIPNNRFELIYAYLGGRDIGGFLDLKLGRQYDYDNFSFVAYDGIDLLFKTPIWVALEAYGGVLVNGYSAIDSPIFRPDGTAQGVLSIHDRDVKPVLAVGLRSFGFRDLDARFTFRQIFAPGSGSCNTNTADPLYTTIGNLERCSSVKDGTSEQSLSWVGRARLAGGRIVPWLGVRYDLLSSVFDSIQAGVRVSITQNHSLQLEYLYSYPTFDGDSIFNVFARTQFDDVRLGYDLRAGRFRLHARGFVRLFNDIVEARDRAGSTVAPIAPGGTFDGGGTLGIRLDYAPGYIRADGYAEYGYGGHKAGGDVSTRWKVYRDIFGLEGRLTLVDFADEHRPENSSLSFGWQVGARLGLTRGVLLHAILEDNINKFYASAFRFYAVLDITGLVGSNGSALSPARGIGPGLGQFGSPYGMGMGY